MAQRKRLRELAGLGVSISVADVARILEVAEADLTAFISTGDGEHLWQQSRAQGRAELLKAIKELAIAGDVQAQKLLTNLLAHDDTMKLSAQRIPAAEVRELLGRGPSQINHRARAGDMIASGPDACYGVGDLVSVIPMLWDKLAIERKKVADLARKLGEDADAGRQLKLEQVRRRRRENEIAERKLVASDEVRTRTDRLCEVIKEQSRELVDGLILKLSLPDPSVRVVRDARTKFLERCAAAMA